MAARQWCAADRRRLWLETGRKRTRTSISTTQRSFRNKNEEEWWTTEPWPRRRWPWRSSGEVSLRRGRQCGLTEARQPQPTWRRCCGEASGALDGVAWPETLRRERASSPKRRRRRGETTHARESEPEWKWRCPRDRGTVASCRTRWGLTSGTRGVHRWAPLNWRGLHSVFDPDWNSILHRD